MSNLSNRPSKRPIDQSAKGSALATPSARLAENLRKAEERRELRKRSTLGLYSLKTSDSSFGVPFCAFSDRLALSAAKQLLPQSNLYKVGTFCLFDGKCVSVKPSLILDNKV